MAIIGRANRAVWSRCRKSRWFAGEEDCCRGSIAGGKGKRGRKAWFGIVAGTIGSCGTVLYFLHRSSVNAFSGAEISLPRYPWAFNGMFKSFDHAALRRGWLVYRTVCHTCHSLQFVRFFHLVDVTHTVQEVKRIAGEFEVSIPLELTSSSSCTLYVPVDIRFGSGGGWSGRLGKLLHQTGNVVRFRPVPLPERTGRSSGQLWRLPTGSQLRRANAEPWFGLLVFPANRLEGSTRGYSQAGGPVLQRLLHRGIHDDAASTSPAPIPPSPPPTSFTLFPRFYRCFTTACSSTTTTHRRPSRKWPRTW